MSKHNSLSLWTAETEGSPLLDKTLGQVLFDAAERAPNEEAVVYPGRLRWTWAQLRDRARRLAHALGTLGLAAGERLAVFAPNVPDWITLQWAAALQNLVLVTVNPAYREQELAYVLAQSDCAALFYESEVRGHAQTEIVAAAQRRGLPALRTVIPMSRIDSLLSRSGSEPPAARAADVCMIQYTSGTTGFPKGAMLTHHGLINNVIAISRRRGDRPGERIVHGMPFFHTGGCVLHTVLSAATLATQIPLVHFSAAAALAALADEGATQFCGVPTMLQLLLDHPERSRFHLDSVRLVTTGGAPVPIDLAMRVQRELGWQVTIVFGQTEASPIVTQTAAHDIPERAATTVGYALPHLEVKIVDAETKETLATAQHGELCVRGYSLMRGYYRQTEPGPIDAEGWLHTGDLASMDEQGYVNIVGRIKDMVIRGGENIYSVEIENVLRGHSAVLDAQVVGVPDSHYGEELCAAIRLRAASAEPSDLAPELRSFVAARLARYKVPRYICVVDEYPLTTSGKVQKYKLREQLINQLGLAGVARPTA